MKVELESIGVTSVFKVVNKETQKAKPVALNTVNLLKIASRQYGKKKKIIPLFIHERIDLSLTLNERSGLGPQQAMSVAEKLYLGGYITYPRTESTKYAERFDFEAVLLAVA